MWAWLVAHLLSQSPIHHLLPHRGTPPPLKTQSLGTPRILPQNKDPSGPEPTTPPPTMQSGFPLFGG